jgi:hypothetical protein
LALFFSGRRHAGENLAEVLKLRAAELPPPIQMCDALSRNLPGELQTILAHCLAHARRLFVDVYEHFPEPCRYLLEALAVVYRNDAVARQRQLSPEARLRFHQEASQPTMQQLHEWLTRQRDERLAEPNSALGSAIRYMLKHWEKLTLFLRQAGAPLDNNMCERALKKAILHRKNALFYKTQNGAHVGDLFMSLIYTCQLNAASHHSRGVLLQNTGRPKEAAQDYDQALSLLKQLAADFPNQPELHNDVAGTCVNLASLHLRQGNWSAAKRVLLEGRPHRLAALKANPQNRYYRHCYRGHLAALTEVHGALLEQEDAVRTAETCRDLGWNAPADAYNAACFLSRCIPIVAQHDKLDDKQRQEAAQFYGAAAMKLLREAVSKGYKDVARMKQDTDLAPLRQREDLQKLVAELEGKGK